MKINEIFTMFWQSVIIVTTIITTYCLFVDRRKRLHAEKTEELRLAEETKKRRLAEETEKRRLIEEAETRRLAEVAEARRLVEEEERKIEEKVARLPEKYLGLTGNFRLIKPGAFLMGNSLTPDEFCQKFGGKPEWFQDAPRHRVTLTKPFYMAESETTVGDFELFVNQTGYTTTAEEKGETATWRNPGFKQKSNHPVVCVSWFDAKAYVDWLNENLELSQTHMGTPLYRLPTEAEWEYACRAGIKTEFFWGTDEPKDGETQDGEIYLNGQDQACEIELIGFPFDDGYPETSPVGTFKANPWGLHDMLGNVWEWCSDWYGEYQKTKRNPKGPTTGKARVLRGGSWRDGPMGCRAAARYRAEPTEYRDCWGIRLVLERKRRSLLIAERLRFAWRAVCGKR